MNSALFRQSIAVVMGFSTGIYAALLPYNTCSFLCHLVNQITKNQLEP